MYVLVKNNVVEEYPYSIEKLKADNPNISFPASGLSNETLAELNVFPVDPVFHFHPIRLLGI